MRLTKSYRDFACKELAEFAYIWYDFGMLQPVNTPVKKSFLTKGQKTSSQNVIDGVMLGLNNIDHLNTDEIKELRRKMVEIGLSPELLLQKYKEIINKKGIEYRGSDVLKALESVRELWNLKGNSQDEVKIRSLVQSKSANEITTTLTEVTMKTQEYLKKLKEHELQDEA